MTSKTQITGMRHNVLTTTTMNCAHVRRECQYNTTRGRYSSVLNTRVRGIDRKRLLRTKAVGQNTDPSTTSVQNQLLRFIDILNLDSDSSSSNMQAGADAIAKEIHSSGHGVIFNYGDTVDKQQDEYTWESHCRLNDYAFLESLSTIVTKSSGSSRGTRGGFGKKKSPTTVTNNDESAWSIGFTGVGVGDEERGILWHFQNCITETITDQMLRTELLLLSFIQNGNYVLEALMNIANGEWHGRSILHVDNVVAIASEHNDVPSFGFDVRLHDDCSSGVHMHVNLMWDKIGDSASAECDLSLKMIIQRQLDQVQSAHEDSFQWSERHVLFAKTENQCIVCREIKIFQKGEKKQKQQLHSVFKVLHTDVTLTREQQQVKQRDIANYALPVPFSEFGVHHVESKRESMYTKPRDRITQAVIEFSTPLEPKDDSNAIVSANGKLFIESQLQYTKGGKDIEIGGEFLVDTGATCSLVDLNLTRGVHESQFSKLGHAQINGWGQNERHSYYRFQGKFSFGKTMTVEGLRFVAFDFKRKGGNNRTLLEGSPDKKLVGILGLDVLAYAIVVWRPNVKHKPKYSIAFYDPETPLTSIPLSLSSTSERVRWAHLKMINNIPHVLCSCRRIDSKTPTTTMQPLTGQDPSNEFCVWLGVDSGFNNSVTRNALSIAVNKTSKVLQVVSKTKTDSSELNFARVGGILNDDGQKGKKKSSTTFEGTIDEFSILDISAKGRHESSHTRSVLTYKNVQVYSIESSRRAADIDPNTKTTPEEESVECSAGMISSTLFCDNTVILDVERKLIGFV